MNNSTSDILGRPSLLLRRSGSNLLWLKATFVLYIVTLILGFVGNFIVLFVTGIKKSRKRRPHELFIVNLAVCDLMLIIFFLPFQICIFVVNFRPSVFYCKLVAPLITLSLGASVFTLTVMAVHRSYIITNPFKPTISQRSVNTWLVLVWILSIGLVVPKMLVSTAHSNRCIQQWPNISVKKLYTLTLFTARFVIPLFIVTYAYVRIAKDLAQSTAPRFDLDENGEIKTRTARRENIMVVKTLTVIVVLFVVCMLPYRLATIVMMFGDEHQARLARYTRQYTSVLTIFHSCVNPIAYGTLTKQFRSCFIGWIRWFNSWGPERSAMHAKNREANVDTLKDNTTPRKHLQNRKLNRSSSEEPQETQVVMTPLNIKLERESFCRNIDRKETAV